MRYALAIAAAVGAVSATGTANAAHYIDPPTIADPIGVYGNDDPTPRFADTFTFNLPRTGFLTVTLYSAFQTIAQNVNFTTNGVKLNNVNFDVVSRGRVEYQTVTLPVQAGEQTILVSGASQPDGSYNGSIFYGVGAIPEPATWSLMILGFGAIGFAARRRKNVTTSVSYA